MNSRSGMTPETVLLMRMKYLPSVHHLDRLPRPAEVEL